MTTERQVSPYKAGAAAVPGEYIGYEGRFDEGDSSRLPFLGIGQPNTQGGDVRPGYFWIGSGKDKQEIGEAVSVVIEKLTATRMARPPYGEQENKPYCFSADRTTGQIRDPLWVNGVNTPVRTQPCSSCPHFLDKPWEVDVGCFKELAAFVWIPSLEELAQLNIRGASFIPFRDSGPGRLILPQVIAGKTRLPKRPIYYALLMLSTEKHEEVRGKYWTLAVQEETVFD